MDGGHDDKRDPARDARRTRHDRGRDPEAEAKLRAELDAAHVRYDIEHYEAKHGYAVDDAEVYDSAAAERALRRARPIVPRDARMTETAPRERDVAAGRAER
jgi:hypothetical protein